jgi:hypothetical protein
MDNMQIWNAVKQPPAEALKRIDAGRLKGKSDINPQWRLKIMTELFGVCGVGWKYDVIKKWNEPLPDGQVFAFVDVAVQIKIDGEWSEAIPGTGGSMLVEQERTGLHANDEAYKMATTDALSVAFKALGVGADVYAGLWDGSKYLDKPSIPVSQPTPRTAPDAPQSPTGAPKKALVGSHWCKIHNTAFFKTEKMHHYAHPIKGSNPPKWCSEPKPPKETQALINTVNEQERFADECKKLGLTEKQALDLLQVDEISSVKDIEGAIKYLNEYADGEDVSLSKGG